MITGYLDILGIPYDIVDVNARPSFDVPLVTDAKLWDGVNHGHYYAIFVGNNTRLVARARYEGLSADERALIQDYERNFDVRQVTWYAYPSPSHYGLDPVTATGAYDHGHADHRRCGRLQLPQIGHPVADHRRLHLSGHRVCWGGRHAPAHLFGSRTHLHDDTIGPYPDREHL